MPKSNNNWEDEDLFELLGDAVDVDENEEENEEEDNEGDEDEETSSTSSEDDYQIVDANGVVVQEGFMPKQITSVKSKSPLVTADDYYTYYPQDRRSRDEINTLISKTLDYFKKIGCGATAQNRSEMRRAVIVSIHVDFIGRVEKIPLA